MSAGIVTGMLGVLGGAAGAEMSAQANERMLRQQIKWEREKMGLEQAYNTQMANSAHQREIADLKAAGLNPILSANGQGAPSPTIQGGNITALPDQSGQILSNSINNALSAYQQAQQIKVQKEAVQAQAALWEKQGNEASANAIRHLSESGALDSKAKENAASALLHEQKTENLRKEAQILQNQIDNKELYKQQIIQEIKHIKSEIATERNTRLKQNMEKDLIKAQTKLTETKEDLYKMAHIAGVVASAATGIGGIVGAIANSAKIYKMIKGATKIAGFTK